MSLPHSPGPWTACTSSVLDARDRELCVMCSPHWPSDPTPAEREANQRLMVASPELLAVLDALAAAVWAFAASADQIRAEDEWREVAYQTRRARGLLARVRGEAKGDDE